MNTFSYIFKKMWEKITILSMENFYFFGILKKSYDSWKKESECN